MIKEGFEVCKIFILHVSKKTSLTTIIVLMLFVKHKNKNLIYYKYQKKIFYQSTGDFFI